MIKTFPITTLIICLSVQHASANDDTQLIAAASIATHITTSQTQTRTDSPTDTPSEELPSARGVLRAAQTAEIAAGMSGKLLKVPYKPGSYFKKGALLAQFDCKRERAELEALTRGHETLSLQYENTRELQAAGAAGSLELDIARSEMLQARAEKDALRAALKACEIYAPYNGYVLERQSSAFESPQAGAPLYSISKAGALEVSIIAPSRWMRWLGKNQSFSFNVDETATQFSAKIVRIGAFVDPVSQTIEITGIPKNHPKKALAGMSGVAQFTLPEAKE